MNKLFLISVAGLLTACQQQPQSNMIIFLENEQGIDPYKTRIISTPEHIRLDDGEGSVDYVIFDRKKQEIYNVNAEMHTVMIVQKKTKELLPPIKLEHENKDLGALQDAPKIKGQIPRHFQYITNGQVCVDVVSVEGLMPDALKGLREYHSVLASDSVLTFGIIPADMHDPCDISMSTFAPTRHLQNGFPVQEWKQGYARVLVDYNEEYKADPKLFELPKDYLVYKLQDYRDGKVDFENRKVISDTDDKGS